MKKYESITKILEKRILSGDYSIHPISSERKLAEEMGVSHMTLRKAVKVLIEKKILFRESNGRLSATSENEGENHFLNIAFLVPAFMSTFFANIFNSLIHVASKMQVSVRSVNYLHWDDPVIKRSLDGFDGVFLYRSTESMPDNVIKMLCSNKCPVAVFEEDMAKWGIPSITVYPTRSTGQLFDHLKRLGHKHINCLNTQPIDSIIRNRISEWEMWMAKKHLKGEFINDPVESYEQPIIRAYEVMGNLLDTDRFNASALFCTIEPTAIGAMRAITERKISVGSGISVCSASDEGLAHFLTPSLTTVSMPDITPILTRCLKWMAKGGGEWDGSLLLEPDNLTLFIGESTASPDSR